MVVVIRSPVTQRLLEAVRYFPFVETAGVPQYARDAAHRVNVTAFAEAKVNFGRTDFRRWPNYTSAR